MSSKSRQAKASTGILDAHRLGLFSGGFPVVVACLYDLLWAAGSGGW